MFGLVGIVIVSIPEMTGQSSRAELLFRLFVQKRALPFPWLGILDVWKSTYKRGDLASGRIRETQQCPKPGGGGVRGGGDSRRFYTG